MCAYQCKHTERCGAVVKRQIQDRTLASSTPASTKCCVLDQDILFTLLSTSFYERWPAKNAREGIGSIRG